MKIKKNITINLGEDEVKDIIAKHLNEEGYRVSAEHIELSVGKKYTEDYDERFQNEVLYFKGCTALLVQGVDCEA